MATGGDAVLIVIEPVHEGLNRDGEDITRTNELPARPETDAADKIVAVGADDGAQFPGVEERAIGDLIHYLIQINVTRDIGCHAKSLDEQCYPAAIRVAARDWFEVSNLRAAVD